MAKSKIARKGTKDAGRSYGKNPMKSPKVGGQGKLQAPKKA